MKRKVEKMTAKEFQAKHGSIAPTASKRRGRTKSKPGEMNATEYRYYSRLVYLKYEQKIKWHSEFEPIKIKVSNRTEHSREQWYKPDFMFKDNNGQTWIIDVKGHEERVAINKMKVIADKYCGMYDHFAFVSDTKNGWKIKEF